MRRGVLVAAVVIATALVGIVAGWQFALWTSIIFALGFGAMHAFGAEIEVTSRWSSALYGNEPEDRGMSQRTRTTGAARPTNASPSLHSAP